jgi:hypothetical protein
MEMIFFTQMIVNKTPDSVKYVYKQKFEIKLLVWICISPRGISKPFFQNSGLAINQNVYLNKIIKKKLVPYINTTYPDGNYVFWPKCVVEYLDSNQIYTVP